MNQTLACWNGFLWSFGNTLVSTTLILYILFSITDQSGFYWIGLVSALVMAAPQLIGIIRVFTPKLFSAAVGLPQTAAFFYACSGIILLFVPCVIWFSGIFSTSILAVVLVILWSGHHINEYIGTIALETWIGNIVPVNSRGHFYARRSRFMLCGAITASIIAFSLRNIDFGISRYILWAWVGAIVIIFSNVPLFFCTESNSFSNVPADNTPAYSTRLFFPLTSRLFCLFLLYGISFSFVNGLTQSTQFRFTIEVLHLLFECILALTTLLRVGQWLLSWPMGIMADRAIRTTMIFSQCCAAGGLMLLSLTTPESLWLTIPAWIIWSGYSGLNIGTPKYLQSLAQINGCRPATFALYSAAGGAAYSISLILSGGLSDIIVHRNINIAAFSCYGLSFFAMVLFIGAMLRFLLVPLLAFTVRSGFSIPPSQTEQ